MSLDRPGNGRGPGTEFARAKEPRSNNDAERQDSLFQPHENDEVAESAARDRARSSDPGN